jgi:hypothetical protein
MNRQEYIRRVESAVQRMRVKASLAKLELRDARHGLANEYDSLMRRLRAVAAASDTRWHALRQGCDDALRSFRRRFSEVVRQDKATPVPTPRKSFGATRHETEKSVQDEAGA